MRISFPADPPAYCGPDLVLTFPAFVEGGRVRCAITAEALEDHFGAASPRVMLEAIGGRPVLLHSGVFRFYA
ncbi:hypothetical protein WI89_29390 [Burkholderia ubonensis]|uniref:DUF1488 domain-containing protein n=1 Tax=Burkholderia ubonensis TaxID=101571 RepID=UPI00075F1E32|nr:DUF1488 domain-containing protein [Burkholderia ubonensis]KVD78963.1 hypothetical protein WI89_29390 [Burkholderia ubonensis]